jgi:hypothetical protein
MEAPESVVLGLRGIRAAFNLRWNSTARSVGERSFDVNGKPREIAWDPRWELWDTDEFGAEYRVMVLEDESGAFVPPGEWLVDLVNLINPARYDGDMEKMIQALVDDPNENVRKVGERQFESLTEHLAEYFGPRRSMVTVDTKL